MKTKENIIGKSLRPFSKRFLSARLVQGCVAASATFLAILGTTLHAQTVYSVNIVGYRDVADRTTYLLTTPMTVSELQALHAHNFYELPPVARPVYLHVVAYAVGYSVVADGESPTSEMLVNHLKDVMVTSIYGVPSVPRQLSETLREFLPGVDAVMEQLNTLISAQVANDISYQDAMYSGAFFGVLDQPCGYSWKIEEGLK